MTSQMAPEFNLTEYCQVLNAFALTLCGDHHVASEMTQETLLRGWQRRDQIGEMANRKAWLFQVMVNLWRDRLRKKSFSELKTPSEDVLSKSHGPDELALLKEEAQRAIEGLRSLPAMQRQVLHLRSVDELSIDEIAIVLGTNRNNVKSTLSLARKAMRKYMNINSTQSKGGDHASM